MIKKAGSRDGSPACQVPRYNHPNCLFIGLGWLIGSLIRSGLIRLRLTFLTALSLRPLTQPLSRSEQFFLSNAFSYLIELILPVCLLLGLWLGYELFYRQKLKPWLWIGPPERSAISGDRTDLIRQAEWLQTRQAGTEKAARQSLIGQQTIDRRIAGLMYDMKTPLATMRGDSELLRLLSQEPTVHEIADRLARNEQRLEHLIARFSDGEGEAALALESLSWPMLWSKLQAAYAHHRPPVLFYPDEVPAGFVTAEEAAVLSPINEIISNASRYASEQIVVIADKENDRLNLSICDDGPGFSPEALKQATTAYYTEGSSGGHIGYGLYQVEQTLSRMNIDLELRNDPGACVCLRLPLKSS